MHFETNSEDDYKAIIPSLFEIAGEKKVWLFTGYLGAGKTTMIQKIMHYLGSDDEITSPTFTLVNEYIYPQGVAYHLDLFRIKDTDEAIHIGIEDYLDSGFYCFIEWPEIAIPIFDDNCFKIQIEILDMSRRKIILQ